MKLDVKTMEWDELDELLQVLFCSTSVFVSQNEYKFGIYDL